MPSTKAHRFTPVGIHGRATERTDRWLDRCLDWRREHAPAGQLFLGIVQGGVDEDLRVESAQRVAALPRHLLGIGDVDDVVHAVGAGIDWLDCATPTRLACHGTALVPEPEKRWRLE